MDTQAFIKRVMEFGNIEDHYTAERGVQIVFSILSYRLTEEEQHDVAEQLPADLKRMWNNRVWIANFFRLSGKRLKYRHLVELMSLVENEIKRENLNLHPEKIIKAVFHALKEQISEGESYDIALMLPGEIREFYKAA